MLLFGSRIILCGIHTYDCMLNSSCGENTRGIDQMPASILHFLAISDESCTRIHDWVVFMSLTMGKNLLHPSSFPALSCIPTPLFCCLWLLLPLGVRTMPVLVGCRSSFTCTAPILLQAVGCCHLDTSLPSCRNCPSAQSRRLPQHHRSSSGF